MANWCYTSVTITHNDCEKIKGLAEKLSEWTSRNYAENDFGNEWLGNIVLGSQIGTVDTGKATDIRCRGMVAYMETDDNRIFIQTETAYETMLPMWKKLIAKYLPDAELQYTAEDSEEGVYMTNKESLIGKYIIESWEIEELESDYEAPKEKVIEVLQKLLHSEEQKIEKLIELFEESDYYDQMRVYEWEFISIDEIDY